MMNKKTTPPFEKPFADDDWKLLERRIGIAISEQKIAELEKQIENRQRSRRFLFPGGWKTAALWISIISLPLFALLSIFNSEKGIFNRYYAPYDCRDVAGIYRGLASEMYTPYYLYSRSDYTDALPKFRQYLEVYPSDVQAMLLLAICHIEKKDFADAETELTRILDSGNIYFREDAHWYLALLSVRSGNFETASQHLTHLKNNPKYKTLAESLENRIE